MASDVSTEQTDDRVRAASTESQNDSLDQRRERDVAAHLHASPQGISERLKELDREWDVERVLAANASSLILLSLALGRTSSPRWRLLSAVVSAFLLQHALQGWCPPLTLFRKMGVRSRKEIDAERTALKAIRGDFEGISAEDGGVPAARRYLQAAERR